MYKIVIATGRRADYGTHLNADHLVADWPLLRRGFGRGEVDGDVDYDDPDLPNID
ncbi:hypothetical protein [Nonomuraea sp. CA-141351]|uniref:hypothetical protein n=1 Tax=Nonomuraea sp. CA-141351 TaxID=3239996 RepID=UPI003D90EBF0